MIIFIAGDSTAAKKEDEKRPESGWGEYLSTFFSSDVEVCNHAANGRSSKSFILENRLETIKNNIAPGDFLFIQFGHNDEKDDPARHTDPSSSFRDYLSIFVQTAIDSHAFPVFLTPIVRRHFSSDGVLLDTHGEYPASMKKLAKELSVPVLDMTERTADFFSSLGDRASKEYFLILPENTHPNYPRGVTDNTHLCVKGARSIAAMVATEISRVGSLPEGKTVTPLMVKRV